MIEFGCIAPCCGLSSECHPFVQRGRALLASGAGLYADRVGCVLYHVSQARFAFHQEAGKPHAMSRAWL